MSTPKTPTQNAAFERQVGHATNDIHRAMRKVYDRLDGRPEFYIFRAAVLNEVHLRIENETPF